MQGRKTNNFISLLISLVFSVGLISCGGGGGGDQLPAEPLIQPTGNIAGIGFGGLLINSDVSVYDWSTGAEGTLLGTTKTGH